MNSEKEEVKAKIKKGLFFVKPALKIFGTSIEKLANDIPISLESFLKSVLKIDLHENETRTSIVLFEKTGVIYVSILAFKKIDGNDVINRVVPIKINNVEYTQINIIDYMKNFLKEYDILKTV